MVKNYMLASLHGGYDFAGTLRHKKVSKSVMDKFNGDVNILFLGKPPYYNSILNASIVGIASVLGPDFIRQLTHLIKYNKTSTIREFLVYLEGREFKDHYRFAPYLIHTIKIILYSFYFLHTSGPDQYTLSNMNERILYDMINIFTKDDPPPNFNIGYGVNETVVVTPFPYYNVNIPGLHWTQSDFDKYTLEAFQDNGFVLQGNPVIDNSFEIVNNKLVYENITAEIKVDRTRPFTVNSFSDMEVPFGIYVNKTDSQGNEKIEYDVASRSIAGVPNVNYENILSQYADYLTASGKNGPNDVTYIFSTQCQGFQTGTVHFNPDMFTSHPEIPNIFKTYHQSRIEAGMPPIVLESHKGKRLNIIDEGSGRISLTDVGRSGQAGPSRPSRRDKHLDIFYITTDYDSISAHWDLSYFLIDSFINCFDYMTVQSSPIDYFRGLNTVLFYKNRGTKPLFFFSYRETQNPGRKPTVYIYNVCSAQKVKIPGFFRKSMRMWIELNMHKYDKIVLGVDMKQPIERAIRLIRLYGTIGFTPMNITTNVESLSQSYPDSLLLAMIINTGSSLKNIGYVPDSEIRLAVASACTSIMDMFMNAQNYKNIDLLADYYGIMMAGVAPVEASKTGESIEEMVKIMGRFINNNMANYPVGHLDSVNQTYIPASVETRRYVEDNVTVIINSLKFYGKILKTVSIPAEYADEILTKTYLIDAINHFVQNADNYASDPQALVQDINTRFIPQFAYMNQRIYFVFKNTNSDLLSI